MLNMNKTKVRISDKNTLRLLARDNLTKMTEEQKKEESNRVCEKLKIFLLENSPETLIAYMPLSSEININPLIYWYKNLGKNIVIIIQHPEKNEIPSLPINSVILIPGRAFTKDWKRIGRWSGYYDRLLEKNPNLCSIGICFRCQIFPDLPEDSWDRRVDKVVFSGNTLE